MVCASNLIQSRHLNLFLKEAIMSVPFSLLNIHIGSNKDSLYVCNQVRWSHSSYRIFKSMQLYNANIL